MPNFVGVVIAQKIIQLRQRAGNVFVAALVDDVDALVRVRIEKLHRTLRAFVADAPEAEISCGCAPAGVGECQYQRGERRLHSPRQNLSYSHICPT